MNAVDNLVNLIDQLQTIESSLTRVMTEIIMKLCSLTSSSVLLVVQNDNVRRVCGTDDLKAAYRQKTLEPRDTDLEMLMDFSQHQMREQPLNPVSNSADSAGNRKRAGTTNGFVAPEDGSAAEKKIKIGSPQSELAQSALTCHAFDMKPFPAPVEFSDATLEESDSDVEILGESSADHGPPADNSLHEIVPFEIDSDVPLVDCAGDAQFQAKAEALRQIRDPFLPFTKVAGFGVRAYLKIKREKDHRARKKCVISSP